MRPLDRFGKELATQLGDGPADWERAQQRAAIIAATGPRHPGPRRTTAWWPVATGLAALAALAIAIYAAVAAPSTETAPVAPMLPAKPEALACFTDTRAVVASQTWIASSSEETRTLTFGDGSRVEVLESTRVFVGRMDRERVEFRLEAGELSASVESAGQIVWTYDAGPYRVTVLGTVLRIRWEPERETLTVGVSRGKVMVDGPTLRNGRVTVRAGETVVITHRGDDVQRKTTKSATDDAGPPASVRPQPVPPAPAAATSKPTPSEADEASAEKRPRAHKPRGKKHAPTSAPRTTKRPKPAPVEPPVPEPAPEGVEPAEPETPAPAPAPAKSWRDLANEGDYKGAYALVGGRTDGLTTTASAADLLMLADVARLSGHPGQAMRVLLGLRRRFPGGSAAARATLRLGRIAMDQLRDNGKAVRWFSTYLREHPKGRQRGSARGMLMQALTRLGRRSEARRVALDYLKGSRRGAYCPVAHTILGLDPTLCER